MSDKIMPDLQSALLCEEVRQEINGNFMLIGILGIVHVPALPITALKLCLFTRWCCGLGQFSHHYRLVLPDNTSVIASAQGEFQLASVEDQVAQISVFGNVQFQQQGIHWLEILLDGELLLRFPLPLKVVPPQPRSHPPSQ